MTTSIRTYLSNISPLWPVKRQREMLASLGNDTIEFCDELHPDERRGYRVDGLFQRTQMLRPTTRNGAMTIAVASLGVLARNAEDLLAVIGLAAERGATIRDVNADFEIKPNAKMRDMKRATEEFAKSRVKERAADRGKFGGQKSGAVRAAMAKEVSLKFENDWCASDKTNKQIVKESGLSVNTLKLYLGRRADAKRRWAARTKRKYGPSARCTDPLLEDISYVYLAKRNDGPVWKIGYSAKPQERMKQIGGAGKRFRLAGTWPHRHAYRVERLTHKLLRLKTHLASEGWEHFKGPKKTMVAAIEEAIRMCNAETIA